MATSVGIAKVCGGNLFVVFRGFKKKNMLFLNAEPEQEQSTKYVELLTMQLGIHKKKLTLVSNISFSIFTHNSSS